MLPDTLKSLAIYVGTDRRSIAEQYIEITLGQSEAAVRVHSVNNSSWAHGATRSLMTACQSYRTWYGWLGGRKLLFAVAYLLSGAIIGTGVILPLVVIAHPVTMSGRLALLSLAYIGLAIGIVSLTFRFDQAFPCGCVVIRAKKRPISYNSAMFVLTLIGAILALVSLILK